MPKRMFRGTGAGPGVCRGPAVHVYTDGTVPDGIYAGAVIIATVAASDLAGLLGGAGAVICEQGGVLSSLAILAREIGVPIVVGVADIFNATCDGDLVMVDGSRGLVTVEPQTRPAELSA